LLTKGAQGKDRHPKLTREPSKQKAHHPRKIPPRAHRKAHHGKTAEKSNTLKGWLNELEYQTPPKPPGVKHKRKRSIIPTKMGGTRVTGDRDLVAGWAKRGRRQQDED